MDDTIEPINFKKLLRDERRKARLELRRHQPPTKEAVAAAATMTTSKAAANASATTTTIRNLPVWNCQHSLLPHPLPILDSSEHTLLRDPPSIDYIADFLPARYQEHLMAWLQQVPEASASSSSLRDHISNNNDKQQQDAAINRWTNLPHAKRRVALFTRTAATSFPEPLEQLANELESVVFGGDIDANDHADADNTLSTGTQPLSFNHILVNEYQADQGILPHTDGPAYASCTATISLGASVLFRVQTSRRRRQQVDDDNVNIDNDGADNNNNTTQQSTYSVLLHGGSLIVFKDQIYDDYLHSIAQGCWEETAAIDCLNAPVGTVVERGFRMSLTFRHKKELVVEQHYCNAAKK